MCTEEVDLRRLDEVGDEEAKDEGDQARDKSKRGGGVLSSGESQGDGQGLSERLW